MRWPAQLLRRKKDAHKYDFGHVLVVAGSPTMLGAAALTGLAAMRAGAGLTTIATAKSLNLSLQKKISPVIMTLPLPETRGGIIASESFAVLNQRWKKYTAVAIGPGMSTSPGVRGLVADMYKYCPLPMVVDADALNALVGKIDKIVNPAGARILTPHMGEMSRISGLSIPIIAAARKKVTEDFVKRWRCVIVLKGHLTVVAAPDDKVYVNRTGNSALATAGSGDVLSGIIAALLSQGESAFEAARFAVWWHGLAGRAASKKLGKPFIIATDIIDSL